MSRDAAHRVPTEVKHVMRGDLIRLLYSELLHRLPLDKVISFITKLPPLGSQETVSMLENVEKIWTHGSMVQTATALSVINEFKQFCMSEMFDAQQLIAEAYTTLKRGSELPSHVITRALFLKSTLPGEVSDLRQWLLRIQERLFRFSFRNSYFSLVHEGSSDVGNSACFAVSLDIKNSGALPPSDIAFWLIPKLRYFPLCINCPPYEEVVAISDVRSAADVCTGYPQKVESGYFYVGERRVGTVVNFSDFLTRHSISAQQLPVHCDLPVIEITEPVMSGNGKEELLHQGCVYGAPVHLFWLRYDASCRNSSHNLDCCIKNDIATRQVWKPIKAKHHLLRSQLATDYHFKYHGKEGAMYMNGKLLVRNIPALILLKIIEQYCAGYQIVERKTLLDDPSIVFDRNNPGIEIRLQRLCTLLQRLCPLLQVNRSDRGLLHVSAHCSVHLDVV